MRRFWLSITRYTGLKRGCARLTKLGNKTTHSTIHSTHFSQDVGVTPSLHAIHRCELVNETWS